MFCEWVLLFSNQGVDTPHFATSTRQTIETLLFHIRPCNGIYLRREAPNSDFRSNIADNYAPFGDVLAGPFDCLDFSLRKYHTYTRENSSPAQASQIELEIR